MYSFDEKNYIKYPLLSDENLINYINKYNLELCGSYEKKIYFYYLLQNIISPDSVALQNNDLSYYLSKRINNKSHNINNILLISKYTFKELTAYIKISEYAVSTYNSNDHDFNKIIKHIKNSNWLTGPYVYSNLKPYYNRISNKILEMKSKIGMSDKDNENIRKYISYIDKSVHDFVSLRKELKDTFKAINISTYNNSNTPIKDIENNLGILNLFEQLYDVNFKKIDFSNFYLSKDIVSNIKELIHSVSSSKKEKDKFNEIKDNLLISLEYGFRDNEDFIPNKKQPSSEKKVVLLNGGRGGGC